MLISTLLHPSLTKQMHSICKLEGLITRPECISHSNTTTHMHPWWLKQSREKDTERLGGLSTDPLTH